MLSVIGQVLVFFSTYLLTLHGEVLWNLQGKPEEGYYLEVLIGTPPQKFNVLVDTGSTNFAIAASNSSNSDTYFIASNSSSFSSHNQEVSVLYTQGFWKGHLGSDVVWFPNVIAPNVTCDISLIESSYNFYIQGSHWQGILGLAYPLIAQPNRHMVSWLEAVYAKHSGFSKTFSLELCGSNSGVDFHVGSFQLIDEKSHFTSKFSAPLVREWFYEIALVGIDIGNETIDLPCQEFNNDKTIIDSGTTGLRLPNKSYIRKVYDTSETMGRNNCYKFAVEASDTGTVLGVVVMEGLIVVFNQTNKTVFFNESACGPSVKLSGPFKANIDLTKCSSTPGNEKSVMFYITAYIIGILVGISGLVTLYCTGLWLWERCYVRRMKQSTSYENLLNN